jgi:hypothetical protein
MLIDLEQGHCRRNEPIVALDEWATVAEHNKFVEQVNLLNDSCPRYDVYTIE